MDRFIDNRKMIHRAIEQGILNGLEDAADRICQLAIERAPVGTGTLQRGISARRNMGVSYREEIVKTIKEGNRWVEKKVPGDWIHVPVHSSREASPGVYNMEFGSYAKHSRVVEVGSGPHEIKPDPSRDNIGGEARTNPHLRFKVGNGKAAFAKRVMHPGTKPQPFMAPAVDAVRGKPLQNLVMASIRSEMRKRGLQQRPT